MTWLSLWPAIPAFILTGILSWGFHSLDVGRINDAHKKELAIQAEGLIKRCDEDKKITQEASDEYQKHAATLASQLGRLRRQTTCILPVTYPALGSHAATGTGISSGSNGVPSQTLYDLAAKGEDYRIKLISLQAFVEKTWVHSGYAPSTP